MKKKLAVIGAGSAGIQTLCHFLYWFPTNDWEITLLYNPEIPSLGIGESTNGSFSHVISLGLNFDMTDMPSIDATYKFGTRYVDWREQTFIGSLIVGNYALHFNTHKLKEFALPRLHKIWGEKFKEEHGNVKDIIQTADKVDVATDDRNYEFDYVINCSGFPTDFTNYVVYEDHLVNHGLIHNVEGNFSSMHVTEHVATIDGWMFKVPLTTRLSHGYLFNDKITSVSEAKSNFANKINVDVEDLQNIEYSFKAYINNTIISNRIFNNGNQAFFFEPMFANSLMNYNIFNRHFYDYVVGNTDLKMANQHCLNQCYATRDTLYFKYHGGSIYETEFWKRAKEYKTNWLNSETFHKLSEVAKVNNESGWEKLNAPSLYSWHGWSKFDKDLGYNYFAP